MFSFNFSVKNILICSWLVLLMVLFIFNIVPKYSIEKVGTREYLSILSFVFVCIKYYKNKYYKIIIISNWSQVLLSIFAATINGTTDFWYVQFALRNILYINGALLIASFLPKNWNYYDYLKLIIIAITVNSIIAVISFVYPSFGEFVNSLQSFGDDERIEKTMNFGVRMIGVGSGKFYVGGIINGMGIILTFYLMIKKEINYFYAVILLVLLFFIGVFIARTTIIGFAIGLLFFLKSENMIKAVWSMAGLGVLTFFLFYLGLFDSVDTSHAFEFFTTDTDSFGETSTMRSMTHMYDISFSEKTLFLGDGLSKGSAGGYYMGTDIGWMRNILYFGIIGTIFGYLYYEIRIVGLLRKVSNENYIFFAVWLLYLIVLNFKGLPDYNFMIFLLTAYFIMKQQKFQNDRKAIKNIRDEKGNYLLGSH